MTRFGDPLGRFSRDLAEAGRDLRDTNRPQGESAGEVAAALREAVPVVSGFLRSTVYSDDRSAGAGAVYAAYVEDHSPYLERAYAQSEEAVAQTFEGWAEEVLDHNLHHTYA